MTPRPSSMRLLLVAAILAGAAACASDMLKGADDTAGSASPSSDTDATTDSGAPTFPDANYRGWNGTIVLEEGAWVLLGKDAVSELTMTVWSDGVLTCEAHPEVVGVVASDAPDQDALYGWWTLAIDAQVDPDCPYEHPVTLNLGIGELHPSVIPAAVQAGYDPSALYGWYLQEGDGDVWAIGVAGTESQYAGEPPAVLTDLADDTYVLTGLYLLDP